VAAFGETVLESIWVVARPHMHHGEILGMCMHSGRASNRRHLGGMREGMRPGVVRRRRIEAWSTTGWRRSELKSNPRHVSLAWDMHIKFVFKS